MRVLIVSQYFWPESFRINEVVETLVESGIQVDVLTGKPNYPDGVVFGGYRAWGNIEESWKGARLYRVPIFPRGIKSGLRLALNYLSFVIAAILWGPIMLRRSRPDAVLVYAPSPLLQALPGLLLARIKGCPLVLWVQDIWPESLRATGYVRNSLILWAVGRVVRFIYKRSDLILISSKGFEPSVHRYAPARTPIYCPNSVDESFGDPDSGVKPDVPELDEGFSIVFAGNVGAAQALETILAAAQLLADHPVIRFVILGTGSRLEWAKHEKERRQLKNIFFPGRFPANAMPYLLAKANVLLVTLTNHPIFSMTVPNKVQAYLAVGRPIIACLNGEGAKLISEACAGIAIPAEDADGLAAAALRLYAMSPAEREALGQNGKAYYQAHFNHHRLVNDLISHLRSAKTKGVEP